MKTQQAVKELKEDVIAEEKEIFKKEKDRYCQMLQKVSEDSCKQMDNLKIVLKSRQKQRQENELKLRTMIEELMSEL